MKKAFTIVELIIYMGLLSILLVIITNIFLSVLDMQTESESTSIVQIDARYILSRLSYDIHRASAVSTDGGSLVLTVDGSPFTYAISNGILTLSGTQLTSYPTQISNFSVVRLGNLGINAKPSIKISFTLSDQAESQSYQSTIGIR